ncbi:MAG: hypothetical protein NC222_07040 [Staphylococcus sp.]|nr:hypothetical protein [Staphylococcus sp.]
MKAKTNKKEFDYKDLLKIFQKINTYNYDKIDLFLTTLETISVHAQIMKDQRLAYIIDECTDKFSELAKKSERYIKKYQKEIQKM